VLPSFIFKYNFSLCPGFISSQNYPNKHPSNYFANWTMSVSVPAASKITFVVTDIAIECDCFHCSSGICAGSCDFSTCSFCYFDYIKVSKKLFLKEYIGNFFTRLPVTSNCTVFTLVTLGAMAKNMDDPICVLSPELS